jgi:hypothetical protein
VHDAVADGWYVAECRQGGGAGLQGVQDADEGIRGLLTTFAAAAWTNLIFWGNDSMEIECRQLDLSPMSLGPWSYSWHSAIALHSPLDFPKVLSVLLLYIGVGDSAAVEQVRRNHNEQ